MPEAATKQFQEREREGEREYIQSIMAPIVLIGLQNASSILT